MPKHRIRTKVSLAAWGFVALLCASTGYTAFANAAPGGASYVDRSLRPTKSCASLTNTAIHDTTDNVTFTVSDATADAGDSSTPASCKVTVSATHPPSGDNEQIWIWLPSNGWNGRFQGTGGGGFQGGSQANLMQPLKDGYATGATDTGHTVNNGSFALNSDGTLNWQLVQDNVVGVHEMTVAGKALSAAYYSKAPQYSYFVGCSTGGRQGITEAAQYPSDYDGIMGGSPAINVTKSRIVQLWGQLVMKQSNDFLPGCKLDAATNAAVQACDMLDNVKDGIINDPTKCHYDPHALIGTNTPCGTITKTDADVIAAIWQGARDSQGNFMWYGQARGSSLTALNGTQEVNGQLDGKPTSFDTDWIKYFLTQHPDWDWHTLTPAQFEQFFTQSQQEFSLFNDNPDLTAFNKAGGKMLLWQGQADQLLAPQSASSYFDNVADVVGGAHKAQKFVRLFMAPGVGHCGGGVGPQPTGQLDALKDWVEHHKDPDTLLAQKKDSSGNVTMSRPLCAYPEMATYRGHGHDPNKASSFTCKQ